MESTTRYITFFGQIEKHHVEAKKQIQNGLLLDDIFDALLSDTVKVVQEFLTNQPVYEVVAKAPQETEANSDNASKTEPPNSHLYHSELETAVESISGILDSSSISRRKQLFIEKLLKKRTIARRFHCLRAGCTASFCYQAAFDAHTRSHTVGLRRYRCTWPQCTRTGGQRGNLRSHVRVVHFKFLQKTNDKNSMMQVDDFIEEDN